LGELENACYRESMIAIDPTGEIPQNIYKLLVGSVVPRPIAFVSSVSAAGIRNLAPFSFFTVASSNPPVIVFQNSVRPGGGFKDTLSNIRDTGEFVVNVVSEDFAREMNATSADVPPDVDEWELSGLTPLGSTLVKPERVGESRIQMECRLLQIVPVSDKPLGGSLVLGEVVRFHVAPEVFQDFRIDPDVLRPIGRMGGPTYCRCADRFDMPRP
jgi:flavin reductase (DIM6/NTAB) family NADH-FMN oxidoreductase RutF